MTTLNFLQECTHAFADLISRHRLTVVGVDDSEILLLGKTFSLSIAFDREGLDVCYIDQTNLGYLSYRLSTYLGAHRFTTDDRAQYGQPATVQDRILASLRVYASGLGQRCDDILRGDKAWLAALKKRDGALWAGLKPSERVLQVLVRASGQP
jgi:hypothetical protein